MNRDESCGIVIYHGEMGGRNSMKSRNFVGRTPEAYGAWVGEKNYDYCDNVLL